MAQLYVLFYSNSSW